MYYCLKVDSALLINKSYDAFYQRGICKSNLKDYAGAIEDFNESLKLKPNYKLATLERGITYYQIEKDALALSDLNAVILMDSKNTRAFFYRGKLKKYMNDIPGSCADLKQASLLGEKLAQDLMIKNGCKTN